MPKISGPSSKIQAILAYLADKYPVSATMLAFASPWQLLVATILAAQCTDARVNQITPGFFKKWPGPAELSDASIEDIEKEIFTAGFYHNKAKNLLGCAKMLTLEHACKVPSTIEDLIRLPGVARKTANVVLFAGFGINAGIAVDTHVKRISYRLGLTDSQDPVRIERDLMEIIPREEWGNFNLRMVAFGRDICRARKPLCPECGILHFCREQAGKSEKI